MNPAKDLTGHRYGRLVATERSGSDDRGKALWKCICDCGGTTVAQSQKLRCGDVLSCGCLVGLVRRAQPVTLYDGLSLAEHEARSGISYSTLDKRVRKYGEVFPHHLEKTRAEQELRVFEQDRENNRRSRNTRMGAAAAWHRAPRTKAISEPNRTTMNAVTEQLQPEMPAHPAPPSSHFNAALTLHRFQQAVRRQLEASARRVSA